MLQLTSSKTFSDSPRIVIYYICDSFLAFSTSCNPHVMCILINVGQADVILVVMVNMTLSRRSYGLSSLCRRREGMLLR